MKFRKKPVVIEAVQWFKLGDHPQVSTLPSNHPAWNCPEQAERLGWINTLEGGMDGAQVVHIGDWIIRGIKGEFYPCKPDVFATTYEPADSPSAGEQSVEELRTERDELLRDSDSHTTTLQQLHDSQLKVEELRRALQAYVMAQSRMLERWSELEPESEARGELWRALHKCEIAARAALAASPSPAPTESK